MPPRGGGARDMPYSRRSRFVATAVGAGLFMVPLAAERALTASRTPELLPVPLVSQARPWTCGGAALMAALLYFRVFDAPESVLDEELGATPDQGTSVTSMVAEARRFGLSAEARTGLWLSDLDRELARGAVVIVALQAWATRPVTDWRTSWEDGHYVVIVGLSGDRVYVMDPSIRTGYGYLAREQFLERWHDYDLEDGRRVIYDRLGIVIRGGKALARYPAEPVPVD
jgi:predicted double-glycine peptidase